MVILCFKTIAQCWVLPCHWLGDTSSCVGQRVSLCSCPTRRAQHQSFLQSQLNRITYSGRDKGAAQFSSSTHIKDKGSWHCVIITKIIVLKLINTSCKCDQWIRVEEYLILVTFDATFARITVIQQIIEYLLLIISKGRLMNAVNSHSAESAVKVNWLKVKLKKCVNKEFYLVNNSKLVK